MARATITDVARLAGVSTATVDRVLNRRPGASGTSRQRVMNAAYQLGYLPSEGQVVLPARPMRLEFFIPRHLQSFLSDLADRIESFASTLPLVSSLRVHDLADLSPETLLEALGKLSGDADGVGLVSVDHPVTRQAVQDLVEADVKVVTMASDLLSSPRATYVGIDDRIAGRTAGQLMGRFNGRQAGAVALFVGTQGFHGQRERELGFRSVVEPEFPQLELLPTIDTRSDNRVAEREAAALLERRRDLVGLYCMGGGRIGIAQALAAIPKHERPMSIMHDLSDDLRRYLVDGVIDIVIDQNAQLVAEQSVIRLLGSIAVGSRFLPVHYIEPRLIIRENVPRSTGA
ncbi:substrate-binding domain-containing protein [Rhodobacterales bacterium HKCCE3408]|nr:substrate-binding domain-containing protein [Rhodobacterales bacterium HKCCE3408]